MRMHRMGLMFVPSSAGPIRLLLVHYGVSPLQHHAQEQLQTADDRTSRSITDCCHTSDTSAKSHHS